MAVTSSSSRDPVSRVVDLANNEDLGERAPGERGDGADIDDDDHIPNLTKLERIWWQTKQWIDRRSRATRLAIMALANAGPGSTVGALAWVLGAGPAAVASLVIGSVIAAASSTTYVAMALQRARRREEARRDLAIQHAKRSEEQRVLSHSTNESRSKVRQMTAARRAGSRATRRKPQR